MLKRVGANLKTLPLRHLGGGTLSELRSNYTGTERYNQAIGYAGISKLAGLGWGHLPPSTWLMPYKAGAISSRNDSPLKFTIGSLNVAKGINVTGNTNILFTASGAGQAVASLQGAGTITFVSSGAMFAPFNMVGDTTITFASSATLRADASITGSSTIQFDTSLTTGANGFMVAIPISTELTADTVASAVWNALAASNSTAGTMGEKLNDAGSASNPWTEIIESGYTAAEILKLISSVLYGKTIIDGTTVKFRDIADSKDRITATMVGSERNTVTIDES